MTEIGRDPRVPVAIELFSRKALRLRHRADYGAVDPAHKLATNIFWSTGLAAAASMAVGWGLVTGIAVAAAEGGSAAASVGQPVMYVLSDTGLNVLYGAGGFMLGFALISLMVASHGTLPDWLRWISLIIVVLAVVAPAYFPAFAIPIWGLVIGVWLIAAGRSPRHAVVASQRSA